MSIFEIEPAKAKRKCHQCGSPILKNKYCMVVHYFNKKHNLCYRCMRDLYYRFTYACAERVD